MVWLDFSISGWVLSYGSDRPWWDRVFGLDITHAYRLVFALDMTIDERMDRLTGIVEALATTVVSHDDQIEELIKVGESQQQKSDDLRMWVEDLTKSVATTERQWQAYCGKKGIKWKTAEIPVLRSRAAAGRPRAQPRHTRRQRGLMVRRAVDRLLVSVAGAGFVCDAGSGNFLRERTKLNWAILASKFLFKSGQDRSGAIS
jgi:tetrahydromethanopterin S-methyltransferase subunit B